ncbi:MAG: hypothetical protein V1720_05795 [bacterium]
MIIYKVLNWFLLSLTVYFSMNVLKALSFLIHPSSPGLLQYLITTFLQLAFGIFFCFATVENTNWKLKPKLLENRIDKNELG